MKRKLLLIILLFGSLGIFQIHSVGAQTITVSSLSVAPPALCPGIQFFTSVATTGFSGTNLFTVQLSDQFGSFNFPYYLGSVTITSPSAFSVSCVVPEGTPGGPNYF